MLAYSLGGEWREESGGRSIFLDNNNIVRASIFLDNNNIVSASIFLDNNNIVRLAYSLMEQNQK